MQISCTDYGIAFRFSNKNKYNFSFLVQGDRDFVCTQQINDCWWWSSNHGIRYLRFKYFLFVMKYLLLFRNRKNICVCLLSLEFFYWFYMYSFLYLTLTWYFSLLFTANINDRSMLGDRDSELAVCVQDVKKTVSSFYHQFFFSWIIRKKYVEG